MPGYFFDVVAKAFSNPFSLIFKKKMPNTTLKIKTKKNLFKIFYGLEVLLTPIVF